MNEETKLFISEQIKEQVHRDVALTFQHRNPGTTLRYPLTGFDAMLYGVRWIQYCKLPNFIH